MPRLQKPKQLSLFTSPAARRAARKKRAQKSPRQTSKRAKSPAVDLLGEIGPEIVQKMAELAREGDVRAASLVFKLLENPGLGAGKRNDSDENSDTSLEAFKELLSGL
ncbi:MAG: hypothetical protein GTO55_01990, partial [Armatimonadetes bacterium]|nr:hypothetical protein [Armatimonadota bacterium]NIM23050.1 hypothetical protein [Armatimonadota bacterium]NIM66918.1 hypothetical protein [Armatimonadota bacterium]NIM75452.1 hypothetical protein [Armatimonadota bacterium]NIN05109.1 hypothetical protein [Armatimonadota bacterium]